MGGKKKGGPPKEPDVTIPEGDPKAGRAVFDELCAACHAMTVLLFLFRVIARPPLPPLWPSSLARLPERGLTSLTARP